MTFDITLMRPGGVAYISGQSSIPAAAMNYITASLANSIDPINGGTFTGLTQVVHQGAGWRFHYTASPGLEISGGFGCRILSGSTLQVNSGGFLTLAATSTTTFTAGSILTGTTNASFTVSGTSTWTFAAGCDVIFGSGADISMGGDLTVTGTGEIIVASSGLVTIESGAEVVLASGGILTGASGSTVRIDGAFNIRTGATGAIQSGGTFRAETGCTFELQSNVNIAYSSARTFTRTAPQVPWFDTASWAEGIFAAPVSGLYTSTSNAGATNDRLVFSIDPPDGCTITSVSVWTDPPGGHAGEPATKTTLELYEQNVATGAAITQVFTLQDPATVAGGTYEPAHAVTQSGLTLVVDKSTKTYFVVVFPEFGANSIVGTMIWPPRFTFTRVKLGEE